MQVERIDSDALVVNKLPDGSTVIVDTKTQAASPEQRLANLGARVGLSAHSKAKPLLDLAQPFSFLMQSIEAGAFNDPAGAILLYTLGNVAELNAEVVIDQYRHR